MLRQFRSAVAVLRGDWEDLERLIETTPTARCWRPPSWCASMSTTCANCSTSTRSSSPPSAITRASWRSTKTRSISSRGCGDAVGRGHRARSPAAPTSGCAPGCAIDRSDVREFLADDRRTRHRRARRRARLPAPFVVALDTARCSRRCRTSVDARREPPTAPARPGLAAARGAGARAGRRAADPRRAAGADARRRLWPSSPSATTWAASIGRHSALIDAYSRSPGCPTRTPARRRGATPRRGLAGVADHESSGEP